jgi:hypothetical protein
MKTHIRFTEEDWARHHRNWSAWWAGELDRPLVVIEHFDPAYRGTWRYQPLYCLPMDWSADQVLDFYEVGLAPTRYYGDAWPKWWPNWGPGIVAGFLGCHVRPAEDTVWFEPGPQTPAAIEKLHFELDEANPWWRRLRELTARAVERWGPQVNVALTDLGGNMDILSSFRTAGQLLLDVIEQPEEVARLVGQITRLWIRYYDELYAIIGPAGRGTTPWAPIWSPKRCYMLQSDFTYMISPAMFERFVLPDLTACCDRLDHGFYHLDGKGQLPHLDMLLSMPRLRGVQWIPGAGQPEAEEWLPVLARIIRAGKLCQVFTSPEGAMKIVRELGGKGFLLSVAVGKMNEKEILDLVKALAAPAGKGR